MGLDCTFLVYPGKPLSPSELAKILARAVTGKLGEETLAIRHATGILPRDRHAPLHAIAAYEKTGRHAIVIPEEALAKAREGASLSQIVQAAWSATRKSMKEAPPVERRPRLELPDDWLMDLACELSKVRGRALWVTSCDHACIAGHASYTGGKQVALAGPDEQHYGDAPDQALAAFAGVEAASVDAVFLDHLERSDALSIVVENGVLLPRPRPLAKGQVGSFELVL